MRDINNAAVDLVIYSSTFGTFVAGGAGATEPVGTATLTCTDSAPATLGHAFDASFGGAEGHIDFMRAGPIPGIGRTPPLGARPS